MWRRWYVLASVCFVGLAVGCGSGDDRPTVKLHGKVTLDGEPLTEGVVQFTSPKTGETAAATLQPNGRYEMTFEDADIDVIYEVTVSPPGPAGDDALAALEKPVEKVKSPIPPEFSNRVTSGLTATIHAAGDHEFNFELKTK